MSRACLKNETVSKQKARTHDSVLSACRIELLSHPTACLTTPHSLCTLKSQGLVLIYILDNTAVRSQLSRSHALY